MKRELTASLLAAAFAAALAAPAIAQQQPVQQTQQTTTTTTTTTLGPNGQYGDPVCGDWAGGVWTPNGHCPGYTVGPRRARIAGTITAVRGHLVTVQLADRTLVINDQPALNRETSGRVAVGRQIIAYGYWRDGNFYATALE
ncbi:MAG TPA: hypothetical protein VMF11_14890 [Candidatus Baltobacteraceae bacterium]|nr:hypothetical protein [Candidatus Baltobacteraceae bacterium]